MADTGCTDLAYEIDAQGQQVLVASKDSTQKVFLRFVNKSSLPVMIWWRDFQGLKKLYAILGIGLSYEIDSFVTHPWEVTGFGSEEKFSIENQPFYTVPGSLAGKTEMTTLEITVATQNNC